MTALQAAFSESGQQRPPPAHVFASAAHARNGFAGGWLPRRVVWVFVSDALPRPTLKALANHSIRLVPLRCTGYHQVDTSTAWELGIRMLRVPTYSPHAVAEHAVALLLALNRKSHLAYQRTKANNFTLDRLMGFDLYGKRIDLVGIGKIGAAFTRTMLGFSCRGLAYDKVHSAVLQELGVQYLHLYEVPAMADVLSLYCPLLPDTLHQEIRCLSDQHQPGRSTWYARRLMALQTGQLGALGVDVYELKDEFFFADWSAKPLPDGDLDALTHTPNVLFTAHQGFFTREAMD